MDSNAAAVPNEYIPEFRERHEIPDSHSIIGIKGSITRGTGYINSVSFVLWSEKPATDEERKVMMKKSTDSSKCKQFIKLSNIAVPVCLLIFTSISLLLGIPEYKQSDDLFFYGMVGRFAVVLFSIIPMMISVMP